MKKILFLIVLVFTTALFAKSQRFTVTDVNGKTLHMTTTNKGISIDEYKNKVLFVEFFGHMCPPCLASIPHYNDLMKKYKNKLQVIAIEVQNYNDEQVKEFGKENGINYTLLSVEGAGELYRYMANRSGWTGAIPYLIATDTKGSVKFIKPGLMSEAELESLLNMLSN